MNAVMVEDKLEKLLACLDNDVRHIEQSLSQLNELRRLVIKREHGKAVFFVLKDASGKIQLYGNLDNLGEEAFDAFRSLDLGDIAGYDSDFQGRLLLARVLGGTPERPARALVYLCAKLIASPRARATKRLPSAAMRSSSLRV